MSQIHPPPKSCGIYGRGILWHEVKGVHCLGKRVIISNEQTKNKSVNIQKVELNQYGMGLCFNVQPSIPLPFENGSIP